MSVLCLWWEDGFHCLLCLTFDLSGWQDVQDVPSPPVLGWDDA